ncbi:subtilase-type serine protease [Stenotrophomonas maltophilia]|uniref:autotransporter domain-containing protein n=1 Tax=Stenotrophomonas chelatiphaga TaxID=517011 RepID=UPI000F4C86DA|nr:autotransporter serine protease [Stenotrophomonas chelatiphaga]MCS4230075.1 subtilase-type serine protease [Stenotrophomonas chelatiphaga]ROQ45702.1 subtilase-type serine protease [Stenotrophomonas maltophilia]
MLSSFPLSRSRLSLHIATALMLAGFSPAAMASPSAALEAEQQRRLQSGWSRGTPAVTSSSTAPPLSSPSSPTAAGVSRASLDRSAWRTEEFNADWGLGAINADAAYARGLSGKGVRLAVLDTGTDLTHPEFAGKDHRSLRLAQLLADGSRCAATRTSIGPDACSYTEGDEVFVELTAFSKDMPESVRRELERDGWHEGYELIPHGTHVAGTIAANRDGVGMHGVSFGSDLVVAKGEPDHLTYIAMQDGQVRISSSPGDLVDQFLPQFYDLLAQQGVRAVNHSWGFTKPQPETEAGMDAFLALPEHQSLIDTLATGSKRAGLIQVWAAGNHDNDGAEPEESPVAELHASVPLVRKEVEPYWLSVVNVDRNNRLDGSMRCGNTAQWCLAAPGTDILSTVVDEHSGLEYRTEAGADGGVEAATKRMLEHGYVAESGTSMAAPHVTGALGLLFERFPYLDNAQVRDVLLTTATDLGEEGVDKVYGWGLMNLEKAIEGYGQLRVDTDVVMNTRAGGLKVWEGDAWDDWTNDIGGPGALTKSGIGWLRLSGDNSFNGAVVREGILELDGRNALAREVVVEGGQLRVNGSLAGVDLDVRGGSALIAASGVLEDSSLAVDNAAVVFNGMQRGGSTWVGVNGLLQGTGTLGDTRVAGIIAPGHSIGTLTINGDYVQTASGRYLAELAPGERSDLLQVSGTANLGGTLQALPEAGIYYLGEQFRVLQAEGGVRGRFADADFTAFSPFLQFAVGYAANAVHIDVTRGLLLASAASTANQRAVAGSADTLAIHQGLPRPLTMLFPEQVGAALDGLSGELHAAIPLVLVEASRHVRDAALGRAVGARSPQDEASEASGVWVQAIGGSGQLDGSANTARTRSNSTGMLLGIEHEVGGWQLGALLGNGRTDTRQAQGRASKARIDNRHVGLYTGNQWGGFGLRGGAVYSRHDLDTARQVAFAGYSDSLTARYRAKTTQAFIEAGYRLGDANASLEPYLQVAGIKVKADDVRETGGAAALRGRTADARTTVTTAGVRFSKGLAASFQRDAWLNVVGGVGYRRTAGDRNGLAQLAFDGGSRFAVSGAPMADHAAVAELGLSAWLSPRQQLELGYSGQFGSDSRDHGANARWSLRF